MCGVDRLAEQVIRAALHRGPEPRLVGGRRVAVRLDVDVDRARLRDDRHVVGVRVDEPVELAVQVHPEQPVPRRGVRAHAAGAELAELAAVPRVDEADQVGANRRRVHAGDAEGGRLLEQRVIVCIGTEEVPRGTAIGRHRDGLFETRAEKHVRRRVACKDAFQQRP